MPATLPWIPYLDVEGEGSDAPRGAARVAAATGALARALAERGPGPRPQVAVVGLGVAGMAMARLLAARGARLVLVDARSALGPTLAAAFPGAALRLGPFDAATLTDCPFVALSPGVAPNQPAIVAALQAGATAFGEVALLPLRRKPSHTAAITGTNGKSTTTALAGALVHACDVPAFVGGNLGDPLADWVADPDAPAQAVLELSSYQIDGAAGYAPDVAAVLNLAPDHLARYGDEVTYARSKRRLLAALPRHGVAVLNADDKQVVAMAPAVAGTVLWFGQGKSLPGPGLRADGDVVHACGEQKAPFALAPACDPLGHPRLFGAHNRSNALAARLVAAALLHAVGAPIAREPNALRAALARGYATFDGLPHRLQSAGTVDGVRYINDSKATNDASVATAVAAMDRPYWLLLGGLDDGSTFAALVHALRRCPPAGVVCFGAAGPRLQTLVANTTAGACPVLAEDDLDAACATARAHAGAGANVLLSPGCKSFDAFADYRARGAHFVAWVQKAARRATT